MIPVEVSLESARIRLANGVEVGPFDAVVRGERTLLLGDWAACFRLLEGTAELVSGRAEVGELAFARALADPHIGFAPAELRLPPHWTLERYLLESARLLGPSVDPKRARSRVIARFELAELAKRTLATLSLFERRLLAVCAASLGEPRILLCETPFELLELAAADRVASAIEAAAQGCALVLSASALPPLGPTRQFADRAELIERAPSKRSTADLAEARGGSRVQVVVAENAAAFANALAARGLHAERRGAVEALFALIVPHAHSECARFEVELGEHSTSVVLEAARDANAALLELERASAQFDPHAR